MLKPGGKLCFFVSTPYVAITKKPLLVEFEAKVEEFLARLKADPKLADEKPMDVPMFLEKWRDSIDPEVFPEDHMDAYLQPHCCAFLFDERIARYFLEREGFIVEKCEYRALLKEPWKLDGREKLDVIARKA